LKKKVIFNSGILFFLVFGKLYAQDSILVRTERPRIEISQTRFDELKELLTDSKYTRLDSLFNSINEGTKTFTDFVSNDKFGINLSSDYTEFSWRWSFEDDVRSGQVLQLILLLYNISDNSPKLNIDRKLQEERIKFIAKEVNEYIIKFNENNFSNCRDRDLYLKDFRIISRYLPYIIDWGYDALDEELRTSLINEMWETSQNFMSLNVYPSSVSGCENDYFAGGHSLQNNMLNLKLILSIFHSKELSFEKQASLNNSFLYIVNNLESEFIPAHKFYIDDDGDNKYGENEGGSHWGGTYSKYARRYWTEIFDLFKYATNRDYYNENPWFNSTINQDFYYLYPDMRTLHLGDGVQNWQFENDKSIISLFNNFNQDKNVWMMQQFENGANSRPSAKLDEIILKDWSKKNEYKAILNPASNNWFSQKTGTIVYKSSWEKDATMVSYFCPTTYRNNHQQLDANSFQIFIKEPLFVDSGVYDYYSSDHYLNYYSRTIAHNTITVHNGNGLFGSIIANDGGQEMSDILFDYEAILENYKPDNWHNVIINDSFNYCVTEATSFFNTNRIKSSVRKFYYDKKKNRVIVLDYVDKRASNVVKFNAHFINRPIILNERNSILEGNPTIPNHIIEYEKNVENILIENPSGGRAILKPLFPDQVQATLVGGDNYEHFVFKGKNKKRGRNYPPQTNSIRAKDANWRLELNRPKGDKQKKELFVNTIAIGNTDTLNENLSELITNNESTIAIKWDKNIYLFSSKYEGKSNEEHLVNLDDLQTNNYTLSCFDLLPNTLYTISIDEVSEIEMKTDAKGFLIVNLDILNTNQKINIKRG
jgi:hypothetical protein